jgi:hypothetical protein
VTAAIAASQWRKMSIQYSTYSWQLCMAGYGVSFGARLLWPELTGFGESHATALQLGVMPAVIGLLVLAYSVLSALAVFLTDAFDYMRAMLASLGAVLWTTIGLVAIIGELKNGFLPTLGLFELLGGVGLSVSLVQRARDPLRLS